ncbi:hypothetical protein PVK06_039310 [Gossypium arboreum]|uniref:Reverse transcriptase domain-containing protein n=1 Tax=Gossypium arboreum TaxID=29729 RepID=A0ABR0N2S3_GOSAR|nr:hypothetical protein PVK06_039310 [Gossypium arboreum]
MVETEIENYSLVVLNGHYKIEKINSTSIILIPKVASPKNMRQFRPISLCNILYKVVSNVLVNRFQKVLIGCIDKIQEAFMVGRKFFDNIFVAYEILHSLKKKKMGSTRSFTLKLDMSKAYDQGEWSFLENVMGSIGFCNVWTSLVMRFSRLLHMAREDGKLQRVKIGHGDLSVSYLFFADDSILSSKTLIEGENFIKVVVDEYEAISGQLVNFDKSLIFFGGNVENMMWEQIGRILGVRISNNPERYLGLPTIVGKRKKQAFMDFKEKLT